METTTALHLLQVMIDYFEAGNQESDAAAKAIVESDFESADSWEEAIVRLRQGAEWSGLRGPEAEIVATALRTLHQALTDRPG